MRSIEDYRKNKYDQKSNEKNSNLSLLWSKRKKQNPFTQSLKKITFCHKTGFNLSAEYSSTPQRLKTQTESPKNQPFIYNSISRNAVSALEKLKLKSTTHKIKITHHTQPSDLESNEEDLKEQKDLLFSTNQSDKSNPQKITENKFKNYRIIKSMGKGLFGYVFLAEHIQTGFIGALKVIQKSIFNNLPANHQQKMKKQLINQIKIQSILNHPNLIKLYQFFSDEQRIYLFMELGTDGHLFKLLSSRGHLEEETTSIIIRQIAEGIKYMHSKFIIHRDIKLQNIVFTCGMTKICDFGWSTCEPNNFRQTICGTPLYLSPQILKGKKYDEKIDVWALGTIAHQLATGKNPFNIRRQNQLQKIVKTTLEMKTGSLELKSFINCLLKKEPENRLTADLVLRHPFITKYIEIETAQELFTFQ